MKILILGANGMLGRDLDMVSKEAGHRVEGFDLPELDITRDTVALDDLPACDWVVNCAAYTDVDRAESDGAASRAVNDHGVANVAGACVRRGVPLIHISTDYVFDGVRGRAYREDDPTNPLNEYGRSKLAGEGAFIASGVHGVIVRTQSLFGINGRSFVRAIRERLLQQAGPVKVVTDQVSSPTYTVHLARAILRLMATNRKGIVHVSASGGCSWFEFACAIANRMGATGRVLPCTSEQFPRPARRPAYSVLDKARYKEWTGDTMPTWEEGLDAYFADIGKTRAGNT